MKLTVGDIIITWYLKLFCSAVPPPSKSAQIILENMYSKIFGANI